MLISVILCSYNPNEQNLARALDAILLQDLSPDKWELVVVDNNSSVPLKNRKLIVDRHVKVVSEARQGLSAARECGIKQTLGDILVFVDDDNLLAPDYLRHVSSIFENRQIGVVSGAIYPEYEIEPPEWFHKFEIMLAVRRPPREGMYLTTIPLCNEYFPVGAGMAVRRQIVLDYYRMIAEGSVYISGRVGNQLSSAEDIDLDFFAISKGFLIGIAAVLKLTHIIPAARLTAEYLCRLAVGTTTGAVEVNSKWKSEFGMNVYSSFNCSRFKLMMSMFVRLLFYFKPEARIRYHFYKTQLKKINCM